MIFTHGHQPVYLTVCRNEYAVFSDIMGQFRFKYCNVTFTQWIDSEVCCVSRDAISK